MSQFSIFFVPLKGDERSEEALNLCLRTRRVLQVGAKRVPHGKPDAGNPHVRFDEGEVASCTAEASLRRVHCRRQPEGRASVCVKVPDGVLKAKGNVLEIDVTNTWRNRLIGDELEPPDVEFAKAPYPGGDMMLAYPDWFGKGIASRPSKGRKCFATWNYFNADAKDKSLMPSGLVGPVELRICGRICANADAKGE